ncbi:CLUMA_CG005731, isoform A [Clunio marinus]|uniref:CLUMA_CG005731, isoform A n=1 Tax=Clunio marinus TaxID=568069 RepID=A0A1J1I178_9DIPT|nr:CLUMA_CG005731, isoform A [Clunio marinus]
MNVLNVLIKLALSRPNSVDNWGTFFLQKLQNFFNKTDYCDLTLQFLDNSQLKVHRLVLSACTDYFNMLEQSCEMVEDILIMPNDLQADVIVPIVNFMYTGTLEFHYNMYEKLLKTSREMNMTVLSKLLEAHRQTSGSNMKQTQPVLLNKNATGVRSQPKVFYQKPSPAKTVFYKQGQTIIKHVSPTKPNIPEPIQIVTRFQQDKNSSRPSRFTVPDDIVPDAEGSFESISYESKPLLTASQLKREEENSPFENLRRGYTNNKRIASTSSSQSPPSKKPNLDDIKAEAEAQRQRNELSGEGEELDDTASDPDYDADQYFEEENDDSEDESNRNFKNSSGTVVKQTTKQITVNDCSGGNIDHAKILGEVLKKYPNLVKNPKNIKLKIMQKPSHPNSQQTTAIVRVVKQDNQSPTGRNTQLRSTPPIANSQPKKIDAKTMHELIRMGAENMKGPWLCLDCGSGGRPIKFLLHAHMRAVHRHMAKNDGTMEYSEDEEYEPSGHEVNSSGKKIEILSNIEIPVSESIKFEIDGTIVSQPSSEAEALTSVATGIATSLGLDDQFNIEQQLAQVHGEYEEKKENSEIITKLVAEDGTELELTAAQKEEILQQLHSQGATLTDNVVMVLDQGQLDVQSDNNLMVMYSESQENTSIDTTTNSMSAIKPEELEKAEIIFQDDQHVKEKQSDGEKSKLISELEEDWTEDDESSQQESKAEEPSIDTSQDDTAENEANEQNLNESAEEKEEEKEKEVNVQDHKKEIVEEANGKLKDILDDWQDEENYSKTNEEAQLTEDTPVVSLEEMKSENDSKLEEKKISEEKNDEDIKKELTESEDAPIVETSEKKELKNDLPKESSSTTEKSMEKSKIITDLLEEWNDDL